jgi:hypothetical protein
MKKYLLTVIGNFKSEEECKDLAMTLTPLVDSPQLKFQHSKGTMIFHFATEIDQDELYEFLVINFYGIVSCFILTEFTDKVSLFLPEPLKSHLLDLENPGEDLGISINMNEIETEIPIEDENEFVALLLEDVKKKIKKPTLDQLLEKIHKKGEESLSQFEKDTLDYYSKN